VAITLAKSFKTTESPTATAIVDIDINGDQVEVGPVTWEKIRYEYAPGTKRLSHDSVAEFTKFPLRLPWATTIHKAQGKSLDPTVIDLGSRAFAPGQTRVAFSRMTSLEGLYLKRRLAPADINVHPDVVRFISGERHSDRLI
jgi:ATP-dependent DNA helicase PIF1